MKVRDRVQLFCFHHAGGNSALFDGWDRALGPGISVVPVALPRRDRYGSLRELVTDIDARLHSKGPYAFFGHSFGALLAYRLACLRAAWGSAPPHALFVSAFAPPHLPAPIPAADRLDDDQLATLLTDLGGIPAEVTQWSVLRNTAVAAARVDLQLCMSDDDAQPKALPCPIHAFGGYDDPLVGELELSEWRSRTTREFSVRMLSGGHFYLNDAQVRSTLLPLLLRQLGRTPSTTPAAH